MALNKAATKVAQVSARIGTRFTEASTTSGLKRARCYVDRTAQDRRAPDSNPIRETGGSARPLYTLFARASDPVPSLLKASGQHSDEHIIKMLLSTCFDGLSGQTSTTNKPL
jgi:hypothetical protein